MTISETGSHPAPTPPRPCEYTLFFIPGPIVPHVESFFADLEEPEEHFLLVPVMRVDQLAWRPERIKRADVRALTHRRGGIWVALTEPRHAARLREILDRYCPR
ncbi:MAG TPA: hypothetical protein VGM42_00510 [Rhodopila sp.]|jgi:hypothetical protein